LTVQYSQEYCYSTATRSAAAMYSPEGLPLLGGGLRLLLAEELELRVFAFVLDLRPLSLA